MSQPTWIGRSLGGRYRIDALLGQGGMSAVYKATDPNLKRVVAIKLIHTHLSSDAQFIRRFEEEATAVASLRHPNIVQVFDFNSDEGTYYMVLEFIPGETLHDRLDRLNTEKRLMSIKEAISYTLNICDALGYAHQRGMVHRDIKPANIMLDIHGQAILMDFGIVKIVGGDSHTATGAVVGTARYMSPEIIRAQVPDERADIYSLGVTLYEMLSGRAPFVADSAMTLMMMHLNDPVPDLRSLRADIPASLVNVLMKALSKDREDRHRSAAEFASALKNVLATLENGSAVYAVPASAVNDRTIASMTPPVVIPPPPSRANLPTQSERSAPPSQPVPLPGQPSPAPGKSSKAWILGVAGLVFLCAVVVILTGGYWIFSSMQASPLTGNNRATETQTAAQPVEATPTSQPTATIPPPTATAENAALPTLEPTSVYPTGYPAEYVRINNITINSSNQYVVDYETFGYTEKLPGMHVHFFFNTVPLEEAGMPGKGPWILYGGPRPFTKYSVSDKPNYATQMCALVANADHTIIADSGNCVELP